jgi:hypothetical protein
MANIYDITIRSEKITQNFAEEILKTIVSSVELNIFEFYKGKLHFTTKNTPQIAEILNRYNINSSEIEIKTNDTSNIPAPRKYPEDIAKY